MYTPTVRRTRFAVLTDALCLAARRGKRVIDRFEGGTDGQGCESTLMGAAYATSVVVLRANGFSSWDRGFNAVDMQVWGATAGPYLFARRVPIEPWSAGDP